MNLDTQRHDEALAREHLGRREYTEPGGTPVTGTKRYRRWSRMQVEYAFRQFNDRHGRPPTNADLGREGLPYSRTVERLYEDGFSGAMRASGFRPRPVGRPAQRHGVRVVL